MKKFEDVELEFYKRTSELNDIKTTDKRSGIYMMYIENLKINNYIPIYIGQSVNLYNRKNAHKVKIKKLFILENDKYNKLIPMNSGQYLYCKLVFTLKNNNKTLDNVKFKVLEYCDEEKLDNREQYWINYFESTIYGFNQFDVIIKSNKLMAEIIFKKEDINYNNILLKGKDLLKEFDDKVNEFDKALLKYKYYSVNYTLLFGNYLSLFNRLTNILTEHFMEIDDNIDSLMDEIMGETDIKLKMELAMFDKSKYIKRTEELFKEFEIK